MRQQNADETEERFIKILFGYFKFKKKLPLRSRQRFENNSKMVL
jgi:hypothetical protein